MDDPLGSNIQSEAPPLSRRQAAANAFGLLYNDKFAFSAAILLLAIVLCALLGPLLIGESATKMNLMMRNAPPFSLQGGWIYLLGGDTLGRPLLPRLLFASQNTLLIASSTVCLSLLIGSTLGLIAGYRGGMFGNLIMRLADLILSFPTLLLAIIVIYMLNPSVTNVIAVLTIARMPVYLRTVRAEVLEVRERMFVTAAQALGASPRRIILRHILPVVGPTLLIIATLEFALVMLAESSLSFLGLGVQPPQTSWGLMVADGRGYLNSAWWLSFWPGLAIMLTTVSLTLLSNWVRVAADPRQRWRLEKIHDDSAAGGEEDTR